MEGLDLFFYVMAGLVLAGIIVLIARVVMGVLG